MGDRSTPDQPRQDPVGRGRGVEGDRDPSNDPTLQWEASAWTLANGKEIADIVEFKQMLKSKEPLIVRCLTEKLLTYSTGRKLEATDRGEVDRITAELKTRGNGLRDLIKLVVTSEIFLTK